MIRKKKELLNFLAIAVKLFKVAYKQCLYILQFVKRLYIDALFVRKLVRPYYNKVLSKKQSLFWYQRFTWSADPELTKAEEFTAFHGGHREVSKQLNLPRKTSQLRKKLQQMTLLNPQQKNLLNPQQKNLLNFETCAAHQFECDCGDCIAYQWLCDATPQCPDGSDKYHCSCTIHTFLCANGFCLNEYVPCNGINDCGDNSDEALWFCPAQEFQCSNGKCIAEYLQCNGFNDCGEPPVQWVQELRRSIRRRSV